MLDVGRRFFPGALLRGFLDAMSYAKMSVLHLHLSDEHRFALQSSAFPGLTAQLEPGGYFTREGMREIIEYAWDRGIRVVPEVDLPAHTQCMGGIAEHVVFCSDTA